MFTKWPCFEVIHQDKFSKSQVADKILTLDWNHWFFLLWEKNMIQRTPLIWSALETSHFAFPKLPLRPSSVINCDNTFRLHDRIMRRAAASIWHAETPQLTFTSHLWRCRPNQSRGPVASASSSGLKRAATTGTADKDWLWDRNRSSVCTLMCGKFTWIEHNCTNTNDLHLREAHVPAMQSCTWFSSPNYQMIANGIEPLWYWLCNYSLIIKRLCSLLKYWTFWSHNWHK